MTHGIVEVSPGLEVPAHEVLTRDTLSQTSALQD